MVGQDQVDHVVLQLARHADAAGLVVDPLRRHDQVADQLPLVGVLGVAVAGELPDLAEVVQEGAGHQQVAVDLRVLVGQAVGQLHDGDGVLEQAAGVGVVDRLGGRGPAQARGEVLVAEEGGDERLDVLVGDGVGQAEQLAPGLLVALGGGGLLGLLRFGRRGVDELGGVERGGVGLGDCLDAELRLALEGADQPFDLDVVLLLEERHHLLELLEGAGLEFAGLVVERDRQVGLAALRGRGRLLDDQEEALDLLAFRDVLDPGLFHEARKLAHAGGRDNRKPLGSTGG